MTYLPYALSVWIFVCGLYGIVSSRNLIHITVCVSVCQSATYVLLLAIGYRKHGTAPIFSDMPTRGRTIVDPVVQSLTLPDIVVSVAVAALLLTFALKVFEHRHSLDPGEIAGLKG
jgi:multicomponent Na+:H+ antiporter subunit C